MLSCWCTLPRGGLCAGGEGGVSCRSLPPAPAPTGHRASLSSTRLDRRVLNVLGERKESYQLRKKQAPGDPSLEAKTAGGPREASHTTHQR